mmetsp:Transcript_8526/g.20069  ORF Transcript_8526/g.20069 Transcript_8526/m.20069 type:complete len:523 (+) Transcript_8526:49-1617(+)
MEVAMWFRLLVIFMGMHHIASKKSADPPQGQVSCGMHKAHNCSACPQGKGESWCNGDCIWKGDTCRANTDVYCGAHWASACAQCPQGQGAAWCNGDCTWRGSTCIALTDVGKKRKDPAMFPYPPDVRPRGCREMAYSRADMSNLTVSIVVPWLEEPFDNVRDLLLSVQQFTPGWLLREIIFVARGSKPREKELIAISDKVRVKSVSHLEARGTASAKLIGVKAAVAPAVAVLSASSRVNRDWLQPLLTHLAKQPRSVVVPAVDIIPPDDWRKYKKAAHGYWRYEWSLDLTRGNPGDSIEESSQAFVSPAAPGIFLVRKKWFEHLHLVQADFNSSLAESEQFELSMRSWLCGGRIDIVPCSRVGWQQIPFQASNDTAILQERRLLAESWLEDGQQQFYRAVPAAYNTSMPQVSALELRRADRVELRCNPFSWYLDMIDHELWWEQDRTCSPGAGSHQCDGELAPGRLTMQKSQLMPPAEYISRRSRAKELSESPRATPAAGTCTASGGGGDGTCDASSMYNSR